MLAACFTPLAQGLRLDHALESLVPQSGLRVRRRLCEAGLVRINSICRPPAYKVRGGEEICLEAEGTPSSIDNRAVRPYVLWRNEYLAVLFKPAGWHSAQVRGGNALCLESLLPDLLPPPIGGTAYSPLLLSRLDQATSGMLVAALSPLGAKLWRAAEHAGRVNKYYVALVEGRLEHSASVCKRLDTANRVRTKVLPEDDPDPARHTHVIPLAHNAEAQPVSLAGCCIRRGARHQIRAHLASLGHPLLGDTLYGAETSGLCLPPYLFFLHHGRLEAQLDGFTVECSLAPLWAQHQPLLPPDILQQAEAYCMAKKQVQGTGQP